jgi:hypothetical protein
MCFRRSKKSQINRENSRSFGSKTFVFREIPTSMDEFLAEPESDLRDPFKTGALTILALCVYGKNPGLCFRMLEFLKGGELLSEKEKQIVIAAMKEGKTYKPFSFFEGALPSNDYRPDIPYTLKISDGLVPYRNNNEVIVYATSSGDPIARPIHLLLGKDGVYALHEANLLSDITVPTPDNPWAF